MICRANFGLTESCIYQVMAITRTRPSSRWVRTNERACCDTWWLGYRPPHVLRAGGWHAFQRALEGKKKVMVKGGISLWNCHSNLATLTLTILFVEIFFLNIYIFFQITKILWRKTQNAFEYFHFWHGISREWIIQETCVEACLCTRVCGALCLHYNCKCLMEEDFLYFCFH